MPKKVRYRYSTARKSIERSGAVLPAALAFVVGVAIFVLTALPPDVTASQSDFAGEVLARLLGSIPGLHDPDSGELLGIGIRSWAHFVEFGALGLFVALATRRAIAPRLERAAGMSLAICFACSLLDQLHKLFVPARHFDGFDLVMDAFGYGLAILVVFLWGRAHRG